MNDEGQESKTIYSFARIDFCSKYLSLALLKLLSTQTFVLLPFRMINGNRGCSYNIGTWNRRKGLVDIENQATYKMDEVKQFIEKHNLHLLCLVETGLHGPASRIKRRSQLKKY